MVWLNAASLGADLSFTILESLNGFDLDVLRPNMHLQSQNLVKYVKLLAACKTLAATQRLPARRIAVLRARGSIAQLPRHS